MRWYNECNAPSHRIIIILYLHTIFCKQLYGRLVFIRFGLQFLIGFKLNVSHVSWCTQPMPNGDTWPHIAGYIYSAQIFSTRKNRLSSVAVFSHHIIFFDLRYVFYICALHEKYKQWTYEWTNETNKMNAILNKKGKPSKNKLDSFRMRCGCISYCSIYYFFFFFFWFVCTFSIAHSQFMSRFLFSSLHYAHIYLSHIVCCIL